MTEVATRLPYVPGRGTLCELRAEVTERSGDAAERSCEGGPAMPTSRAPVAPPAGVRYRRGHASGVRQGPRWGWRLVRRPVRDRVRREVAIARRRAPAGALTSAGAAGWTAMSSRPRAWRPGWAKPALPGRAARCVASRARGGPRRRLGGRMPVPPDPSTPRRVRVGASGRPLVDDEVSATARGAWRRGTKGRTASAWPEVLRRTPA